MVELSSLEVIAAPTSVPCRMHPGKHPERFLACHICRVLPVMVRPAYRCDHFGVATDRLKRIAVAIRKRRQELGLTQEAVAYESETSVRNYARIEAGTVNLRILSFYRIATVTKDYAIETDGRCRLRDAECPKASTPLEASYRRCKHLMLNRIVGPRRKLRFIYMVIS